MVSDSLEVGGTEKHYVNQRAAVNIEIASQNGGVRFMANVN